MSAQAVPSLIAPTVAPPSTGTASDVSDSAFGTMVADVMDGEAPAAEEARVDAPSPGPRTGDDAPVDAAQANPFAMNAPGSLVPPVIPEQTGEAEASAPPPAATTPDAPTNADEPAPTTVDAEAASMEARTAAPPAAATSDPDADAAAGVPAAPTPAAQPANAAPPPAPVLRPLAERASKPLEAAEKSSEASTEPRSSVADPASVGAQPDAAAASPAQPAAPGRVEAIAAPVADDAAVEPEAQAPGEAATTQTPTAAATRDVSLSTLSRGAIDATAQIAAQILRKLEGRSTRFEMALHPEDLGRVDVKLDIDSGGRLSARLAFDNPAAATDLRGRADDLRRQLEDAGFHMADDAFEFAERDSGSSAFDRGQDARHGQNRAFAAASRLNDEIDVAQPPRWMTLKLSPSGVDMKV